MDKASRLVIPLGLAAASAVVMIASIWAEQFQRGAALLMPSVVVLAGAAYLTLVACAGHKRALQVWIIMLVFVGGVSLPGSEERAATDTSVNGEILLSLAMWAGMGMIGLANLSVSYRYMQRIPTAALLAYILLAIASTAYSASPKFTFGAGVGLLCFFLFAATLVARLEMRDFVWALFIALGLHVLLTPIFLVIDPDLVYWKGWVDGRLTNSRVRGLTGHPFGFASLTGMFMICSWILWQEREIRTSTFAVLMAVALPMIWMAQVRTALGAIFFAFLLVCFRQRTALLMSMATAFYLLLLGSLVMPGLLENLGGMIARSDDLRDVRSLTGRTVIWDFTFEKFLEKPVLGHGYGSTRVVLTEELVKNEEGGTASNAHNAVMQSLMTMGIVGTFFFLVAIFAQIAFLLRRPYAPTNAFIYFLLMMSTMSTGFIGMAPGTSTLVWMVMLFSIVAASGRMAEPGPRAEIGREAQTARAARSATPRWWRGRPSEANSAKPVEQQ